jgi:hypothetical protein
VRKYRAVYWAHHLPDEDLLKARTSEIETTKLLQKRQLLNQTQKPEDSDDEDNEIVHKFDMELADFDPQLPLHHTYKICTFRRDYMQKVCGRQDKVLRFDLGRKRKKWHMPSCLEMLCKKQQIMHYQTDQKSHFCGAQAYWIESQIQQLNNWIEQ